MPKQIQENEASSLSVEIGGGLGNQLFMLYGGLYFGKQLGRKVKFNTLDLRKIASLHPGLSIQDLGLFMAKDSENRLFSWLQKILMRFKKDMGISLITKKLLSSVYAVEETGYMDPQNISPRTRFLKGYFQSWKYFELLEEKPILDETCIPSPTSWFKEMSQEMVTQNPIAVHVRRGDYTFDKNSSIGLLSIKYYEEAFSALDTSKPIWVFSDSPDLVENEFKYLDFKLTFVKPPEESDPVESLLLMSSASEIVISNSTFSWWAAFLSRTNTRVIAPSKWYKFQSDPVDLIPSNWARIESSWM